jgi:hypothetical protein
MEPSVLKQAGRCLAGVWGLKRRLTRGPVLDQYPLDRASHPPCPFDSFEAFVRQLSDAGAAACPEVFPKGAENHPRP